MCLRCYSGCNHSGNRPCDLSKYMLIKYICRKMILKNRNIHSDLFHNVFVVLLWAGCNHSGNRTRDLSKYMLSKYICRKIKKTGIFTQTFFIMWLWCYSGCNHSGNRPCDLSKYMLSKYICRKMILKNRNIHSDLFHNVFVVLLWV